MNKYCYEFESNGVNYVFAGKTGLLLTYNDRIKEFLKDEETKDEELAAYILNSPFKQEKHIENMKKDFNFKGFSIFLTNNCNLRCTYCYEKANELDTAEQLKFETFKKAIDHVLSTYKHGRKIKIFYFGGEPLLNLATLKSSLKYLKEIEAKEQVKFTYSITTNGTILNDEIIKLFVDNKFSVCVSIDGPKEINDKNRKFINGQGSYDKVMANIKKLTKAFRVSTRITWSDYTMDIVEFCDTLLKQGVKSVVLQVASEKNIKINEFQKKQVKKNIAKLEKYFLENIKKGNFVNVRNLIQVLEGIHVGFTNTKPKFFTCGAGNSDYSINTKGDIYLCHRFNNIEEYKFGNIIEGIDKKKRTKFLDANFVDNKKICKDCWAKYLCGGGCFSMSYFENNKINTISSFACFLAKEFIKSALRIYVLLDEKDKDLIFEKQQDKMDEKDKDVISKKKQDKMMEL